MSNRQLALPCLYCLFVQNQFLRVPIMWNIKYQTNVNRNFLDILRHCISTIMKPEEGPLEIDSQLWKKIPQTSSLMITFTHTGHFGCKNMPNSIRKSFLRELINNKLFKLEVVFISPGSLSIKTDWWDRQSTFYPTMFKIV